MKIYGAGMAGLLAANMMRRLDPEIHEAQSSLPNNHAALLRFRTDAVSKATGIPFRKVEVSKAIYYDGKLLTTSNLQLNNLYSFKVTGEYHDRSISNLQTSERYIAPPDFIQQMARGIFIRYNSPMPEIPQQNSISTIPMNKLMELVNWKDWGREVPEFKYRAITSVTADIVSPLTELYQTIYFPDPNLDIYRASITGNRVTLEFMSWHQDDELVDDLVPDALKQYFGFSLAETSLANVSIKHQPYGKLLPIDNDLRRKFINKMTDVHGVYSVGRFATWRQILMDDVVKDIMIVESFLTHSDYYKRRLLHNA